MRIVDPPFRGPFHLFRSLFAIVRSPVPVAKNELIVHADLDWTLSVVRVTQRGIQLAQVDVLHVQVRFASFDSRIADSKIFRNMNLVLPPWQGPNEESRQLLPSVTCQPLAFRFRCAEFQQRCLGRLREVPVGCAEGERSSALRSPTALFALALTIGSPDLSRSSVT